METKGNSEDFFDKVAEAVTDSDNFFEDLEKDVNPAIYDDNPPEEQVTPEAKAHPDSVDDRGIDWDSNDNPYKGKLEIAEKRYSDSSREAQSQKARAEENSQYDAIINVMKKDPGLIDTVQNYLESGGKIQQKLPEDFIFDPDEAMSDPNSTSAKVFQNQVERIVAQKVGQSEKQLNDKMAQSENQRQTRADARQWMKNKGMSEEDFANMMAKADEHTISYDDIYTILNQDTIKKNVSKSTKKDVMAQMESVRQAPTTASGTGSADADGISEDDRIFEVIKNASNDNLFDS